MYLQYVHVPIMWFRMIWQIMRMHQIIHSILILELFNFKKIFRQLVSITLFISNIRKVDFLKE